MLSLRCCGAYSICVVQVNKVAGNFHFAAGHSYQQGSMHIHDMAPFTDKTLDFTHKIHGLSFGKAYPVRQGVMRYLAGFCLPLHRPQHGTACKASSRSSSVCDLW